LEISNPSGPLPGGAADTDAARPKANAAAMIVVSVVFIIV